jgi:hypothetical protein
MSGLALNTLHDPFIHNISIGMLIRANGRPRHHTSSDLLWCLFIVSGL